MKRSNRARRLLPLGLAAALAAIVATGIGCGTTNRRAPDFGVQIDPPGTVYTNSVVTFTVSSTSGTLGTVQLLRDGAPLATLDAAPYQYDLDTTGFPEGPTQIVAEVTRGGKTFDSAPTTVVVDRTAPRIISFSPQPRSGNFWSRAEAQAIFSEPLKDSTIFDGGVSITYAAVGVTSGGAVLTGATLNVAASQETLRMQLGALATVPGQVTVRFASTVTDRAGNSLQQPDVTWTWVVPDWQASAGLPLAEAGTPSGLGSSVAFDDNPIAAYALGNHVYVEHWDGVAWQQFDPPQEITAADPILAVGYAARPYGNPTIAWVENAAAVGQSVFVRAWDGFNWQPVGNDGDASAPDGNACTEVALAVTTANAPAIAYTQSFADFDVRSTSFPNGAWSAAASPPASTTGVQDSPAVAIDAAGRAVVAWHDTDGVHAARWNGASFDALGTVISGATGTHPSVAAGGGEPIVAWEESGNVMVSQFDGATAWTSLGGGPIDVVAGGTAKLPRISLDPQEAPVVAWLESDGAPFVVRTARFDGMAWNDYPVLTVDTTMSVSAAALGLDSAGAPFVVLTQGANVYSRRLNGF